MNQEKLCVFCEHFKWEEIGYINYGTSGNPEGGLACLEQHFTEERPADTEGFRELILRAEACGDYLPATDETKLFGRGRK